MHKHGHGEHVGQNLGVAIDAAELQNGRAVLGIDVARGGVDGVREVTETGSADVRTISAADGNGCFAIKNGTCKKKYPASNEVRTFAGADTNITTI
jgi:hypothetical protein